MEEKTEKSFLEFYSSSVLLFNIRFSFYVSKISALLNAIQYQLLEPTNLDKLELVDDDVLKRERRMAGEFERRFSRINLYSIQLKLKKLEKEIVEFRSKRSCKIAQTFVLRALVLSIFKYLANSLHTYSKFIRKLKIPICTKLKDLLNYISHAYHAVSHIVDHSVLKIHDLAKLSCILMEILANQNIPLFETKKVRRIVRYSENKTARRKNKRVIKGNKKITASEGNFLVSRVIGLSNGLTDVNKRKNVKFEICQAETKTETVEANEGKSLRNPKRKGLFTERLCSTTARLCDAVLDDLLKEVIEDITDSIRCLAIEAFDREFKARNE